MYQYWLDEIEQIDACETNEAFTEFVYCRTAKYTIDKNPTYMRRYRHVKFVVSNGVQRVMKTFGSSCLAIEEADFLWQLQKHPNINHLIDIVWKPQNGQIYLILDYCKHGELLEYLKQQKSKQLNISPEIIFLWMDQLLSAIKYMHELNIVHCDIKSQNVFVMDDERRLCIGDMGLAQKSDANGVCKDEIGTPDYQAPENKQDEKPCSTKSDIWGFGCVFFEAMTLYSIYDGGSKSYMLVQNNVVHTEMLKTQYPEIQRRVVNLCLQVDPRKRPSAQALMDMLACSE
jgi:serine/threonine protein kinase